MKIENVIADGLAVELAAFGFSSNSHNAKVSAVSSQKSLSFTLMHLQLEIKPFSRNCSIRGRCGTSGIFRQSHKQ